MRSLTCEFNEGQKWLFKVLFIFSYSFLKILKILNEFSIKCETKAGIVYNLEVYNFLRDIYQIGNIVYDLSSPLTKGVFI